MNCVLAICIALATSIQAPTKLARAAKEAPPTLEVVLPTTIPAPADILAPTAPKDAKLAYSLKVGPLPPITSLAYSTDGKTIAIGSYKAVILFDLTAGKVSKTLTEPIGTVQSLAWSKGD